MENEDYVHHIGVCDISMFVNNTGQIEGLPKNPRVIRDKRFELLKKSITDAPEFLKMRPIIAIKHDEKYVVICGNQRLKACKDLGMKTIHAVIANSETPVEKLREWASKDNISFGDYDDYLISKEWQKEELELWGMEFDDEDVTKLDDDEFDKKLNSIKDEDCYYPIIPKYDEKHEMIIILCDNEVDTNNIRERLGMNKMKSYKNGKICRSNVISCSDFLKCINHEFEGSNTEL